MIKIKKKIKEVVGKIQKHQKFSIENLILIITYYKKLNAWKYFPAKQKSL